MNIGVIPMAAKPYHAGHHMLIELAAISELTDNAESIALPVNDIVSVFISFSSRGVRVVKDPTDRRTRAAGARTIEVPKKGEAPIFGADMRHIWNNILRPNLELPSKVQIVSPDDGGDPSPIKNVHAVCQALKDAVDNSSETFQAPFMGTAQTAETIISIYSDADDISSNYNDEMMSRLYGNLWLSDSAPSIRPVGISRKETVQVSGTQMRSYLCSGDTESFMSLLPPISDEAKQQITDILTNSITCGVPLERRQKQQEVVRRFIKGVILTG